MLPLAKTPAIVLFMTLISVATFGFLKDVSGIPSGFMPNDKVMHALVFWALALSALQAWPGRIVVVSGVLACYGALIEVAQATFTSRFGDPLDFLADVAGIALALLLVKICPPAWFAGRSLPQC